MTGLALADAFNVFFFRSLWVVRDARDVRTARRFKASSEGGDEPR